MLKTIKVLAVISLVLFSSREVVYLFRAISRERVLTRVSVRLEPGANRLYLSLPRGHYLCGLFNEPNLRLSFDRTTASGSKNLQSEIKIASEGKDLVPKTNLQVVKFIVSDYSYPTVEISATVPTEYKEPVYLIVRATF